METTTVAAVALGALVGVAAAGYARDRLRGRREPARRTSEGESRYYRDGGDPTFGYDQGSGGGMP